MLEFIGIVAIIYIIVKYFSDFLGFFIKFSLSLLLVLLIMSLGVQVWMSL